MDMTDILATVHNLRLQKPHNISETGSVSIFRWGGKRENLCWQSLPNQSEGTHVDRQMDIMSITTFLQLLTKHV